MIEPTDPTDPATPPEFRLSEHVRPTIVAYMKSHLPDTRDVLDEIRVPALLVVGARESMLAIPASWRSGSVPDSFGYPAATSRRWWRAIRPRTS
jgi:hypothetical protein